MAYSIESLNNLSNDNVVLDLKFYPQEFYYEPEWNFAGVIESFIKNDTPENPDPEPTPPEEDDELIYDGGGVNG